MCFTIHHQLDAYGHTSPPALNMVDQQKCYTTLPSVVVEWPQQRDWPQQRYLRTNQQKLEIVIPVIVGQIFSEHSNLPCSGHGNSTSHSRKQTDQKQHVPTAGLQKSRIQCCKCTRWGTTKTQTTSVTHLWANHCGATACGTSGIYWAWANH